MNEEFRNEIQNRWGEAGHDNRRPRIWAGLLLLLVGALLLAKVTNALTLPVWLFSWPSLFILLAVFSAIKHRFRSPAWIIFLLIGGFGLADRIDPSLDLSRFVWPVVFIALGLLFLFRPRKAKWERWKKYQEACRRDKGIAIDDSGDRRDFVDITAVFGGVKKNVLSKNFKGGDIVSFMGGSEIDLTQCDFQGQVTIDATNIFGGTKLIVPPTWDVQSDITAIFGGVDDKRPVHSINPDPQKQLLIDGTCLFGGIEIRSF